MADHLRVFEEATALASQFPPLRHVPLVVISSGDQPPTVFAAHQALVQMSLHGRHILASKSGHWVQFDEPELVVEAIRNVVEASRRTQASGTPAD
jgi:pimeloyl-ACP methyl ester carboxylesterase